MRTSIVSLVLVIGCLAGCMPFRLYPLPASAAEARGTFAPLATAASNLGYRYYRHDDRVIVEPDARTRIDYTFDASGNYVMYVMIKGKDVPGGLDAAFAAGKARGDEVWTRAMALRMPVAAVPQAPPAPAPLFQLNVNR